MKFPNFKLLDMNNKEYSLESFDTKKILFFIYPKDDTPGCTVENQDFTKLKKEFNDLNITLVGVSPDNINSHKNFIEKYNLENILLSDPKKELIEKVGAWGEKKNYGKTYMGLIRSTFLVDKENGTIEEEWKNVRAKGHAERVLKIIKESYS